MSFDEGDRIRFPDPLEDGRDAEGTFHEIAVDEPIEVAAFGGGTRNIAAAWVSRDDGTTARVPYASVRPA